MRDELILFPHPNYGWVLVRIRKTEIAGNWMFYCWTSDDALIVAVRKISLTVIYQLPIKNFMAALVSDMLCELEKRRKDAN